MSTDPQDDPPRFLGDGRASQILRVITLVLVLVVLGGVLTFGRSLGELNKDDQLINRGQQVNSCIGDRQDLIDQWRAVATAEFVIQVDRLEAGLPVETSLALAAEEAIYELVDEKQRVRAVQLALIAGDDPDATFTCPAIDRDLEPPALDP